MANVRPVLALLRSMQLKRQLGAVERRLSQLDRGQKERLAMSMFREYEAAGQCPQPHLYQTSGDMRYRPWGDATAIGCERMTSANAEVRLAGMALWIAVAYHETRESPYRGIQAVHRRLVRLSRELRQSVVRKPRAAARRPLPTAGGPALGKRHEAAVG